MQNMYMSTRMKVFMYPMCWTKKKKKKTCSNVIQLRNEHKIAQRDFSQKKAKAFFFWKNLKKYLTREKRGFYTIRRNYRRKKLL